MYKINILWMILLALTLTLITASLSSKMVVEEYGTVVLKQTINLTSIPEYSLVFKKDGEILIEYVIPAMESFNVNGYKWLHPMLDTVNNSLVLTATLTNVTSLAQGVWVLESHMNHGSEKREYFSLYLQVYEKPKGLKCYSDWSEECLTMNCSFQTTMSPEKVFQVTLTLGTGVNHTGVCSPTPSRDKDQYTTVCLAQFPSGDLPHGNHTLNVSVLPAENSETEVVHNTRIQIPLVIEVPAVKVTNCSEISAPGESVINCTCERLDASNITTEITWHINNVTANNQSALIIQNQDGRSSTISMTTNGESTEISCLATNAFSWQSKAVSAIPERKVKITQRKEEPDTNIISTIIPIVIAVMIIISLLVCWKTGLFKKLPCKSQRRVEGPGCLESIELQNDDSNRLYVLTMGMPASGKSAACNLILGRSQFLSSNSTSRVTTTYESAAARFNDKEIIVVDSRGVAFNKGNHRIKLSLFVYRALQLNPNGYDVLIYVFRYKARLIDEDGTMLAFQRAMEANFLGTYGIVVVTNIEQFEPDDSYSSIEEWRDAQTGVFKEIVEACQRRVVFVNNRKKDLNERERMRNEINEMITEISQPTTRFNKDAIKYVLFTQVINMFKQFYNYLKTSCRSPKPPVVPSIH